MLLPIKILLGPTIFLLPDLCKADAHTRRNIESCKQNSPKITYSGVQPTFQKMKRKIPVIFINSSAYICQITEKSPIRLDKSLSV